MPTVLHVGEDVCLRIPVMQSVGLSVVRCECSRNAIHEVFSRGLTAEAVIFHSDLRPPLAEAVHSARTLSVATLVLFQNPTVYFEECEFDLIIHSFTPPAVWLKRLEEVIAASRQGHEFFRNPRDECAEVRAKSRALRALSERNRNSPINPDDIWIRNSRKNK